MSETRKLSPDLDIGEHLQPTDAHVQVKQRGDNKTYLDDVAIEISLDVDAAGFINTADKMTSVHKEITTPNATATIDSGDHTDALHELFVFWFGFKRFRRTFEAYVKHDWMDLRTQWEQLWFCKTKDVDQVVRERFAHLIPLMMDRKPQSVTEALALIILYDQVPRNIFRGCAQATQYDSIGLAHARVLLPTSKSLPLFANIVVLLSFIHSEDVADHDIAGVLHADLLTRFPAEPIVAKTLARIIEVHRDHINAFGRLPMRALARGSTRPALSQQEAMFLAAVVPTRT